MRVYRLITLPAITALLSLIPVLPALSASPADQRVITAAPSQETNQVVAEKILTPLPANAAVVGGTPAQTAWVSEIEDSLKRYKTSYPASNFDPYTARLATVKRAVFNEQKEVVRSEMGVWLKMLRTRAHGINDIAADELFNYSVHVAPIREYRISVPPPVEFGMPGLGQQ
jgi:hypothetical protein